MLKINTHPKNIQDIAQDIASGFSMTFENGNTISIQFGFGNYCDNRNESNSESKDAEVAIWNNEGKWYQFEGNQVKGCCTPDEVAKWVNLAAKYPL